MGERAKTRHWIVAVRIVVALTALAPAAATTGPSADPQLTPISAAFGGPAVTAAAPSREAAEWERLRRAHAA